MYYAQHAHYDETGCFDPQMKPLGGDFPVKVQTTDHSFELSCPTADGKGRLLLFSDGRCVRADKT